MSRNRAYPGTDSRTFSETARSLSSLSDLRAFTQEFTKGAAEAKPVLVSFERGREKLLTVVKVGPEPEPKRTQQAEKPWFGATIQVITAELAEALGIAGKKGVRVTVVTPGSPSAQGGVKEGDIYFKLDGRVINASRPEDSEVFPELIRAYPVGGTVELDGLRDGQPLKLAVTLGRRPQDDSELAEYKDDRFEFTARDLSAARRLSAHLPEDVKGVSIEKVEPNGWAELGGLGTGDVLLKINGVDVDSVATLKTMLLGFRESKPRSVILFRQRGPRTAFIEIEPRW